VAIVTGREPIEARRVVGVPGLLVAGNHGTEWLDPDADAPHVVMGSAPAAAAREALNRALRRVPVLPGVVAEHKGLSAALHYRAAPDPGAARDALVAALGDVEPLGLGIGHGRMVVELRPIGLGDKGAAARAIVERFALRGAVVMGDDTTDLDMFAAVGELRADGRLAAVLVAVGGADRDVGTEVAAAADAVLPTPADVAELLGLLAGS
jgi:trehalose-phosphatase